MAIHHFLARPIPFTLSTIKLLCAAHLFYAHGYQLSETQGPSMAPTFAVQGDWVAADMTHARNRRGALQVGDLVMYRIPQPNAGLGIKRLVGLPGDYVSVGTPEEKGEERMIQVPQGHCWIVGDNLSASRDSRTFGPLPVALIRGKVVAKVLPWSDKGWFKNTLQSVEPRIEDQP